MEKDEYLQLEFQSLRLEIENAKERAFKIYGIGGIVVPIISVLGEAGKLPNVVKLFLPFFILGACVLFLAETRGIKRCGKYIRKVIEVNIIDNERSAIGWESWLNPNLIDLG